MTENALLNQMSDLIWEKVKRRMNASLKNLEDRLGDDYNYDDERRNSRSGWERRYGKGFSRFNERNGECPGSDKESESVFLES